MRQKSNLVYWKTLLAIPVLLWFFNGLVLKAQSTTTGDLAGTVTDATGAVIPGATVTLKNLDNGATETSSTNQSGAYRFSLVKPGNYEISASTSGLKTDIEKVTIAVGQASTLDLVAKVQSTQEVVEVTAAATLVNSENANLSSSFTQKQVVDLPAPGGDLTTFAFTAPGVVENTGMAGYGNFSSHGLPGISNLFTINGNDYNDAYLNLNNSGASNLLLGQNEVQEASIVSNAYSVQYGRQAGAQLNYVTKSGTNSLHGDLTFNFNNHIMNANDFFNNLNGVPRPYAVSREWQGDIGGRIIKDKLFFYSDSEGLYYSLPTSGVVAIPSPALQSYILGTITPAQTTLYQKAFNIWNGAPGAKTASQVVNGSGPLQDSTGNMGCGDFAGTTAPGGGVFGTNVSCALAWGSNGLNTNKEWLETHRVDWSINDKQRMFFRFKGDHGFQPTGTNLLTSSLNEQSIQPQYEGQISHNYIISPSAVNNVTLSFLWYSAIFGPANTANAESVFPTYFQINNGGGANGGGFYNMGVNWSAFPQGRDVGQGQLVDDFSIIKGNHTIKIGGNLRKNRVTDFSYESGTIGSYFFNSVTDFADGVVNSATSSNYFQKFSPLLDAHLRLYNLGVYLQDEWAVKPNLKLTYGIRFDRTANPECLDKCFSRLDAPFSSSAFQKGADIPYNSSIQTGLSHAYNSVDPVVEDPRVGVVWSPNGARGMVIRSGFGIFSDLAPAFLVTNIFNNAPFPYSASIYSGTVNLASDPTSAAAAAQSQYNAFKTGFFAGDTLATLNSAVPGGFSPFNYAVFPRKFGTPQYLEWSFEIEQPIGAKNVFVATYSANHGYNLLEQSGWGNAYSATPFANLPTSAPDPRFNQITEWANDGRSNFEGLTAQFRRAMAFGLQGQISYTWGHAQDTLSNGGAGLPFEFCSGCSLGNLVTPSVRNNYANSDYDVRHNIAADFTWDVPWKPGNRLLYNVLGNWTLASKVFFHTGFPFSVYDGALAGNISSTINATMLASAVGPVNTNCGVSAVNTPCFTAANFVTSTTETTYGNLGRNAFYGPHYVDVDTSVYKNFNITERMRLRIGASAYNLFNHPNFANPNANIAGGGLGLITSTAIPPTSAYGSFQGSAVSGRVLVLTGRFQF